MLNSKRRYHGGGSELVAIVSVLGFLLLGAPARAQNVGTIAQATGNAQVERGGTAQTASLSMPVQVQDTLRTGPNSEINLNAADGSRLTVGPSATMRIDQGTVVDGVAAPNAVDLRDGELHAEIVGGLKKVATRGNPAFVVTTPNAVVKVLGTDFKVKFTQGAPRPPEYPDCTEFTDIDVIDGTVHAVNKECLDRGVDVNAGHQLTIACNRCPVILPWWENAALGFAGVGSVSGGSLGVCVALGCISDSSPAPAASSK
jgi:ferric-dicitrate binding protein FerR (iron transport regulator)